MAAAMPFSNMAGLVVYGHKELRKKRGDKEEKGKKGRKRMKKEKKKDKKRIKQDEFFPETDN